MSVHRRKARAAGPPGRLTLFLKVLDIVLENEKIGFALARQANEGLIVVLDHSRHFFPIRQFHAHRRGVLDQALEIPDLFKRLFRRAAFSATWWRSGFS